MAHRYKVRKVEPLLLRRSTTVGLAPSAPITIFEAGTTTPARIYADTAGTLVTDSGATTTNANGMVVAYLDNDHAPFEASYKGIRYPLAVDPDDPREAQEDLADHAALTGGVHGVPTGETIASQEYVDAQINGSFNTIHTVSGAPSNAVGIDNDYAIDPTAKIFYGPKGQLSAGVWPSGVSYAGTAGPAGPAGDNGTLSDNLPVALGAASAGTSTSAARSDHRHPMPTATDVGAAALTNAAPATLAASAAVGVSATAARADHVHSTAGVLATAAPADIANTAAVGSSTLAAKADHVHSNAGLVRSSQVGTASGVAATDSSNRMLAGHLPTQAVRNDASIDLNGQTISNYKTPIVTTSATTISPTSATSGSLYVCTAATAVTVNPPTTAGLGDGWTFLQYGAGKVTIAAPTGITRVEPDAHYSTAKQNASVDVTCIVSGGTTATVLIDGYTGV